jgi:hypothetical protein
MKSRHLAAKSAHLAPAALIVLVFAAAPCFAARWQEVGNPGISTDKILVDTDSVQSDGEFRLALIMTVFSAPRTSGSQRRLETDEIAAIGEKSTVLVACTQE